MKGFFYNMLDMQLGISIVLIFLTAFRPLLKKHFPASFRHLLWGIVVIRLAIPVNIDMTGFDIPQFYVSLPQVELFANSETENVKSDTVYSPDYEWSTKDNNYENIRENNIILKSDGTFTFDELLILIWFAGILYQLTKRCSYIKEKNSLMKKVRYDEVLDRYLFHSSNRLMVHNNVKIGWCDYDGSPMLLGFFEPIILLPEKDISEKDIDIIITHELTHLKRNDVLFKLAINILECVYWFNPLISFMRRYACEDMEYACDETILAGQSEEYKADYAQAILNSVSYGRSLMLATNFTPAYKTLKERFENIFSRKKIRLAGEIFIVLLTAATIITVFWTGTSFGSVRMKKQDITKINDITVYTALKDDIKWNLRYGHVCPGSVYNIMEGFGGEASLITENPDEICSGDMLNSHSSPKEVGRLKITERDNSGEKLGKSISFSTGMNWSGQLQAVGYENGVRTVCRLYGILPESEEKIVEDLSAFMAQAYGHDDVYFHKSYGNVNLGLHYWDYSTGCVEILLMDNFYYSNWLDMIKQRQKYSQESPYENTLLSADDFPSDFRDFREIYKEEIYGGWVNGGGWYNSNSAEKYFCYVNENDKYKLSLDKVVKRTDAPYQELFTVSTIAGDCGNGVSVTATQNYSYDSLIVYQFIKDLCYMYNPYINADSFYNRFISDIQNNQYSRYPAGESNWIKEVNGVFCSIELKYDSVAYDINDLSVGDICIMDYRLGQLYTVGPQS